MLANFAFHAEGKVSVRRDGCLETAPQAMRRALSGVTAYCDKAVSEPIVNTEEKIDRVVGRRAAAPDALSAGMRLQETGAQLHQSFKHRWMPKGIYRFKTHEEADEWMIKMLARSGLPKT